MQEQLKDFICIYVDDDYAFVAKDFVNEQYTLKRATKVKHCESIFIKRCIVKSGIDCGICKTVLR